MAKSIVTYCDVCLTDDDTYTEARTIPVPPLTDRSKPRTIDLCELHEKQYVTPYVELVQRLGVTDMQARPIAAPSTPASQQSSTTTAINRGSPQADETCPLCGDTYRRTSGESHFASRHPGENRARSMK